MTLLIKIWKYKFSKSSTGSHLDYKNISARGLLDCPLDLGSQYFHAANLYNSAVNIYFQGPPFLTYRKVSNISRTKSQNLSASRLIL